MRTKKREIETETIEPDESGPALDLDDSLADFLNEIENEQVNFKTRLHRIINIPGKHKPEYSWLRTFENEVPENDTIAELYGEGNYRLSVYYNKNKKRVTNTREIRIDPGFKIGRNGAGAQLADKRENRYETPGPGNMSIDQQYFLLLQEQNKVFLSTITGVLKSVIDMQNRPAPGPIVPDYTVLSDTVGQVIRKNAMTTQEILNMKWKNENGYTEPPAPVNPFIELAKTAIETFGEKILNGSSTVKKVYRDMFQGTEQYKQIINNLPGFAEAYNALIEEGHNKEDIDTILKTLNLPVPGIDYQTEDNVIQLEKEA